jgi:quercetin dioxygenase-like cupin family protein
MAGLKLPALVTAGALFLGAPALWGRAQAPAQPPARSAQPVVHPPGRPQVFPYDAGGTSPNTVRFLTFGEETGGAWSLIELTEPTGARTTWHRHPRADQAYYVREGVLTAKVDEKVYVLPAGGYVFIPRGTPHGHANLGRTVARVLLTNAPAGFEHYFKARVELMRAMSPTDPEFKKKLSALRSRYDVEELGVWDVRK